jgi:DNA-directed RNA polymerase omega subunit
VTDKRKTDVKDSLAHPLLEDLLKVIPSKYELVLLAALRAKQIISNQKRGLNARGELEQDVQAAHGGRKPLSIALGEISRGELPREKMYLLEYLESFRRGDEDMRPPAIEAGFAKEPDVIPATFENVEVSEDEVDIEEL